MFLSGNIREISAARDSRSEALIERIRTDEKKATYGIIESCFPLVYIKLLVQYSPINPDPRERDVRQGDDT